MALVLGLPGVHHVPMEPTEQSLRLIVKALDRIGVEVTEDVIADMAVVVRYWPRSTDVG